MSNTNTIRTFHTYPQFLSFSNGSNDSSSYDEVKQEEESKSVFGLTKEIIDGKLMEIMENCNEKDWDGYGAIPITKLEKERAEKLASLLNANIIIPRVVPEPSGNIGFEWVKGDKRLVLAFDNDFLIFSEIDGPENNFGKRPANDLTRLPKIIVEKLNKNFSLV